MIYLRLGVYKAIMLLWLSSLCLLTACGGGGSDSSTQALAASVDTAANSVAENTPSAGTSENTVSAAGRVFLANDGQSMLVFKAGNTGYGYKYANDFRTTSASSSIRYVNTPFSFSWNNQANTVLIATNEGQKSYALALDGKVITDGTQAQTYTLSLPLALADLSGKHLLQTITPGDECLARSLSFSGSSLTVRERCRSVFNQIELTTEMVEGVDNLIHAYGSYAGYELSYYLALSAGNVSGQSKWVIRAERNGAPALAADYYLNKVLQFSEPMMQALTFNAFSSALADTGETFSASLFSKTARTGCGLFNQHYFACPGDYYWQDINSSSCIFTAPIWLVKNGGIACLTDPTKQLANYPLDPASHSVDGRATTQAYRFAYNGLPESQTAQQD